MATDEARNDQPSGVAMADVLATLSLTADLGFGLPMEHVMRSCMLAVRLGEHLNLSEEDLRTTYLASLLALVGCTADSHEIAALFGDDIAIRGETYDFDFVGLPLLRFLLRNAGRGGGPLKRARVAASIVASNGKVVEEALAAHCSVVVRLSHQLELGDAVGGALQQAFTRWDGKGLPPGVGGEDIGIPMRLLHLADLAEVYNHRAGCNAAVTVCRARANGLLDPTIVELFADVGPSVLSELDSDSTWDDLIAADPDRRELSEGELDRALGAVGDFCDLKSPWFVGHSRGVASLAAGAAEQAGLSARDVRLVSRAGSVHDLGRTGVPNTIWDKPGPLTASEMERVRLHAYYGERMLQRPAPLAALGVIAASNHERSDGSGYHRGAQGTSIVPLGRILGAADAYHAMVEDRPHRPAMSRDGAARTLRQEARAGLFDREASETVLAAAGHRSTRPKGGPAGLTPREFEVLVLIARGATTRQVAKALGIAPKTAGNHIERLYNKIGATSRAAAALFAMQAGLLDSLNPYEPD